MGNSMVFFETYQFWCKKKSKIIMDGLARYHRIAPKRVIL
jgi:hypothetical protein